MIKNCKTLSEIIASHTQKSICMQTHSYCKTRQSGTFYWEFSHQFLEGSLQVLEIQLCEIKFPKIKEEKKKTRKSMRNVKILLLGL